MKKVWEVRVGAMAPSCPQVDPLVNRQQIWSYPARLVSFSTEITAVKKTT